MTAAPPPPRRTAAAADEDDDDSLAKNRLRIMHLRARIDDEEDGVFRLEIIFFGKRKVDLDGQLD